MLVDAIPCFSDRSLLRFYLLFWNATVMHQLYLQTYGEGLILLACTLSRCELKLIMDNPMFESRSPSDFWGRRWNLLVHSVLKNGVFKPVYKYSSRNAAVLATFVASGLFHEWLLVSVCAPLPFHLDETGHCRDCFTVVYGAALVFFAWQGVLVAGELFLGHTEFVQMLSKRLPLPMRTALIIGMGIPLAHFFNYPYVKSGFFYHGSIALPMIRRLVVEK